MNPTALPAWRNYLSQARLQGRDVVEMALMRIDARVFLKRQPRCAAIVDEYVGILHPGLVGVFLFRITPGADHVDEWVWTVVGGLPSAVISCKTATDAAEALDTYIGTMLEWLDALERGFSTGLSSKLGTRPSARPSVEATVRMRAGLHFLDHKVLPRYLRDAERA